MESCLFQWPDASMTHTHSETTHGCVCVPAQTHTPQFYLPSYYTQHTHTPVHVHFPGRAAVISCYISLCGLTSFPPAGSKTGNILRFPSEGEKMDLCRFKKRWWRCWNAPTETRRDRLNRFLAKLNLCQVSPLLHTPWLRLLSRTNNSLLPLKTPVDLIDWCFCFSSFSWFFGGNVVSVSRRPKKTSDWATR